MAFKWQKTKHIQPTTIEAHRRTTDYSRQTSNIVKYTKQHLHNGTSFCRRLSRSIQEWTYQIIPHHCRTEKIIPINKIQKRQSVKINWILSVRKLRPYEPRHHTRKKKICSTFMCFHCNQLRVSNEWLLQHRMNRASCGSMNL